jgi:methionine sulfoxide reductase heme-binding subunit
MMRWLKPTLFVLCLLPLARLVAFGFEVGGSLGANPIEFITRSTGTWTLVMLCITLAVTPARRLFGLNMLVAQRRMLGLFAFFYGLLHITTWIWFDHWFALGDMVKDIIKRPFITVGFFALLLMVPLAVTSNRASIKALGKKWIQLHRLIYLIAPLAVLHYWWHKAGKNALEEPAIYAAIVVVLLGIRVVYALAGNKRSPAKSSAGISRALTKNSLP